MLYIIELLLYANATWDLLSAIAIALNFHAIARWHTDLWIDDANKTNPVAQTLMGWLLLTFALARWAAAWDPSKFVLCGVVSYFIEAGLAIGCNGSMKRLESMFIAISCAGLACLLFLE